MYARVVRFTDVDQSQIDRIVSMVEESDGPPPGVDSTGMQLVYDKAQGSAVFVGHFATEDAMRAADAVFNSMDSGETPGTRQSVDQGEVVIERDA
jgi:hypothetical protein